MVTPRDGGRWFQDVLKYIIGGTIAAGLVTFIGFLVWRGHIEAVNSNMISRIDKLESRLDKLSESGSIPMQTMQHDISTVQNRLLEHERESKERSDRLDQILRNQELIIKGIEQWKKK